eukprot:75631-Hanusia_phi.AAC.1
MNETNWYDELTLQILGDSTFTPAFTGVDPNKQVQLTDASAESSSNVLYKESRLQEAFRITVTFEIQTSSANADGMFFFLGSSSLPLYTEDLADGYGVVFQAYESSPTMKRGTNLVHGTTQLAYDDTANGRAFLDNYPEWTSVSITISKPNYDNSTIHWLVYLGSNKVINYTVTGAQTWVTDPSSRYWGFGARDGMVTMSSSYRRIRVEYETLCDAASYLDPTAQACVCQVGHFSIDGGSQIPCTACAVGNYTDTVGSTA